MLRGLPALATVLVPVLLAGCAPPSRGVRPLLRPYDFAYRVRWHGAGHRPRVAIFSDARETYFILPPGGREGARVFARIGRHLQAVPLHPAPPYLVAGCLARRWLVTDGRAGYGAAVARRTPRGRPCRDGGRPDFFGRLVRSDRGRGDAERTAFRSGGHDPGRSPAHGRIARAFRHALEQARRCPGCVRPDPARHGSAALRALGRRCLPTAVFGRGTTLAIHPPAGCRLRSVYTVRGGRLHPLDPRTVGGGEIRIADARPPLLLDFDRGLVALVARQGGRGSATRRALAILVRGRRARETVWPLRRDLRRTLRAWCRQAGCRTSGRIPRFRLTAGRFRGPFPTALRALLRRLAHKGLVLGLRLDRARRILHIRTLWPRPRA